MSQPDRIGHAQPAQQLIQVNERKGQHHGRHHQADQHGHRHQPLAGQQAARPGVGHGDRQHHRSGGRQQRPQPGAQQAGAPDRVVNNRHEMGEADALFRRGALQGQACQPQQRQDGEHGEGREYQPSTHAPQESAATSQFQLLTGLHGPADGQAAAPAPDQPQDGEHHRQYQHGLQQRQARGQVMDRDVGEPVGEGHEPRQQPGHRGRPRHAAGQTAEPVLRFGQPGQRPAPCPCQIPEEINIDERTHHQPVEDAQRQRPAQPGPLQQPEGRPARTAIEQHRLILDSLDVAQPRQAQQRKKRHPLPQVTQQHDGGARQGRQRPGHAFGQPRHAPGRQRQLRQEQHLPAHHGNDERGEQHHPQQGAPPAGSPPPQRQHPRQPQPQRGFQRHHQRHAQRLRQQPLLHHRVICQDRQHVPEPSQRPRRHAQRELHQHCQRQQPQQHQRQRAGQHQPGRKPALSMQCAHALVLTAPASRPRRKGCAG